MRLHLRGDRGRVGARSTTRAAAARRPAGRGRTSSRAHASVDPIDDHERDGVVLGAVHVVGSIELTAALDVTRPSARKSPGIHAVVRTGPTGRSGVAATRVHVVAGDEDADPLVVEEVEVRHGPSWPASSTSYSISIANRRRMSTASTTAPVLGSATRTARSRTIPFARRASPGRPTPLRARARGPIER